MSRATALLAALLLSACSLAPTQPPKAVYDLGPGASANGGGPLAWRIAEVSAPPWLTSTGMAYRLGFQQAQRLEHYRDSLWAAPPAALLTQRLRQHLAGQPGCAGQAPALLAVHLDLFEQQFSSASDSRAVLRLQATLWPASGAARQQSWTLERRAAPDAAGAARALAQAVDDWLPMLSDWLVSGSCQR
ncbi:MAG: ABC-type transport auxiliary lipoprotein family protein [Roseateles sp.]